MSEYSQPPVTMTMTDSTPFRQTHPALTRPPEFSDFWNETLQQLARQPSHVQVKHSETRADGLTLHRLSYQSLGGAVIQAYFLSWDAHPQRPLVIHTHGYVGQCDEMWQWAERGLHVFGFDIRGMGRSRAALPDISAHGYILTEIESQAHSILRGDVCDYVRAHEVARDLLVGQPERIIFYGHSFAGALSLMAAAITQIPDLLVSAVPTLGWAEGRRRLGQNGSGQEINQYLASYPEQTAQIMQVLSYFDTMNFADLLTCPVLVGLGQRDSIVPAATVYAIINHFKCRHEIREYPVSHSTEPEEQLWSQFEAEWLGLAINGVPDTFGDNKLKVFE